MRSQIERLLHGRARKRRPAILPTWLRAAPEFALWAVVLATAVVAIDFIQLASAAQSESELRNTQKLAFENSDLCARRGLRAGTHEHLLCTMDLNAIRARETALFGKSMELP